MQFVDSLGHKKLGLNIFPLKNLLFSPFSYFWQCEWPAAFLCWRSWVAVAQPVTPPRRKESPGAGRSSCKEHITPPVSCYFWAEEWVRTQPEDPWRAIQLPSKLFFLCFFLDNNMLTHYVLKKALKQHWENCFFLAVHLETCYILPWADRKKLQEASTERWKNQKQNCELHYRKSVKVISVQSNFSGQHTIEEQIF